MTFSLIVVRNTVVEILCIKFGQIRKRLIETKEQGESSGVDLNLRQAKNLIS